jgi:hypothetical protein
VPDTAFAVVAGNSLQIAPLAGAYDADGDVLLISHINGQAVTAGDHVAVTGGIVTVGSYGQLSFSASESASGTANIAITVSDGHGGTAPANVTLLISAAEPKTPLLPELPKTPLSKTTGISDRVVPQLQTPQAASDIIVRSVNDEASLDAIEAQIVFTDIGAQAKPPHIFASTPEAVIVLSHPSSSLNIPLGRDILSSTTVLQVSTLIRENQIVITLGTQTKRDQPAVDYIVRLPNGEPLPQWLHQPSKDVLLATPPANLRSFSISVQIELPDGRAETRELQIDAISGAIKQIDLDKRSERPSVFAEQFALMEPLGPQQIALLGEVLSQSSMRLDMPVQ